MYNTLVDALQWLAPQRATSLCDSRQCLMGITPGLTDTAGSFVPQSQFVKHKNNNNVKYMLEYYLEKKIKIQ